MRQFDQLRSNIGYSRVIRISYDVQSPSSSRLSIPLRIYLALVLFSLCGDAFAKYARLDPQQISHPTALITLAAGLIASFQAVVLQRGRTAIVGLLAVAALGLVAELVGLRFGIPFGRYAFTGAWWPTVDVPGIGLFPMQLPFAWLLISGSSYLLVASSLDSGAVLVSAVLATLVDQAMEPALTGPLNYWRWIDRGPLAGGSPVMNAVGWFAISCAAALILKKSFSRALPNGRDPGIVLAGHVLLALGVAGIAMMN